MNAKSTRHGGGYKVCSQRELVHGKMTLYYFCIIANKMYVYRMVYITKQHLKYKNSPQIINSKTKVALQLTSSAYITIQPLPFFKREYIISYVKCTFFLATLIKTLRGFLCQDKGHPNGQNFCSAICSLCCSVRDCILSWKVCDIFHSLQIMRWATYELLFSGFYQKICKPKECCTPHMFTERYNLMLWIHVIFVIIYSLVFALSLKSLA